MAFTVRLILILSLLASSTMALTDPRLPSIFYPFGTDVGDTVSPPGDEATDGPYNIPGGFKFYGRLRRSLYVRLYD